MSEVSRIAWNRWKIITEVFGDFQGRLFAVIFYFTIFAPFALGVRLFSDPLMLRSSLSKWIEREPVGAGMEDARRQF